MVEIDPNRSRKLVLGIDIDGVLADFTSGYIKKLMEASGKEDLLRGEEPPCWYWATVVGYTPEEDKAAWKLITSDPKFWATLRPTLQAAQALQILTEAYLTGHRVYFLTDRPGVNTHQQSMVWLMNNGYGAFPQVLVTADKGPVAKGLGLTHLIDDKIENCEQVAASTLKINSLEKPTCRVFCLTTRYNKDHQFADTLNITRVNTLEEFFRAIAFEEANAIA